MKRVLAGRKIPRPSGAGSVSAAATMTGITGPVSTLIPACAVRQMEHAWRDVVEFSG